MSYSKQIWYLCREEEINEQNKLQNEQEEFISDRNRVHGINEYDSREFWRNNS